MTAKALRDSISTIPILDKGKAFYNALNIRKNLLLILAIIVILISFSSFAILQFAFEIYGNRLIDESSEILNLYSTNIENELRKVDSMSLNLLSNSQVQSYLSNIHSNESPPDRYQQIQDVNNYLVNQSNSSVYIFSVTIIDLDDNAFTVGNGTMNFSNDVQRYIENVADAQNGNLVWMQPQAGDKDIIAAREIRSLSSMRKLGDLFIRIDPNTLISLVSNTSPQYNASLIILNKNELVYQDPRLDSVHPEIAKLRNASNGVFSIGKEKFLINRELSSYSNWTYIYLEPYQYVFQNLLVMRAVLIGCYIFVFLIVLLIGFAFSSSITKPIITLSKKMKRIKDVNFEQSMDLALYEKCDEVGELNNSFILMLNKINELIKENYTKQILIKETQLKALQEQINPHFLYNTLDTINWIAKENHQDRISIMVKSLGNLLRNSINSKESVIKVKDEVKLLQDYINIQKVRFGERLDFRLAIDEEVLNCNILKLTLQPIVENSIKYVLEDITGVCIIELLSRREDDHVEIIIRDNGHGVKGNILDQLNAGTYPSKSTGIGLKNIDERLKLFFGKEYGLSILCDAGQGMIVIIKIPMELGDHGV